MAFRRVLQTGGPSVQARTLGGWGWEAASQVQAMACSIFILCSLESSLMASTKPMVTKRKVFKCILQVFYEKTEDQTGEVVHPVEHLLGKREDVRWASSY